MYLKNRLIERMEMHRGEYLSGEELAAELGVTRAAVWKAIKAMSDEGYQILSVQGKGYMLDPNCDVLSEFGIKKYLPEMPVDPRIFVHQSVLSTNSMLRSIAEKGAEEGIVIISAAQTGGRGRRGRSFFSPPDTGLYMSLLLRPKLSADKAARITTAAAVAVCRALEKCFDVKPQIKWVNDVFIDGKKVCGILTEASFDIESGGLGYAVLGVGINVYAPEYGFPKELEDIAGCVLQKRTPQARARIAAAFLEEFIKLYGGLESAEHIAEYRKRCFVLGRQISVLSQEGERSAVALDVDDDCHLLVRYDDGSEGVLNSGEISVRL